MKVDYLITEIGSTTTLITAINSTPKGAVVVGQGRSYTTVLEEDVSIGLERALDNLQKNLGLEVDYSLMLASSSAAGGLKLTVHGLIEEMTVKAAREAALGAGGNIQFITAGKIKERDIKKIKALKPNLIMISGGTDFGEEETALFNARAFKEEGLNIPIIYCGNIALQDDMRELFSKEEIYIVPNVYPRVDTLNVEPARRIIQKAFEDNIILAPGMSKIRNMIKGSILPTPGAVMKSAELLYSSFGDVMVIDVGGATTDVHSVTNGDVKIQEILLSPEPKAKRTVEGDLGIFLNALNVINQLEDYEIGNITREELLGRVKAIPKTREEYDASLLLARKAAEIAVNRHVGSLKRLYGVKGDYVAYGKDLSKIKYIIGTGGALIGLGRGDEILSSLKYSKEDMTMLPRKEAMVHIDKDYIMSSAGVLSTINKEAALEILKNSLSL